MSGDTGSDQERRRRIDRQIYRVLREEQRRDREEQDTVPASELGPRRPREQRYLAALGRYGVAVLSDLITHGEIFAILRERGWPVAHVAPLGTETEEFVQEWLVLGWSSFMTAVARDRWDSDKSSLRTYFITLCIGRFRRHYQRWWRSRGVEVPVAAIGDGAVPHEGSEELERLDVLAPLPRQVVVAHVVERAPFTEIAAELGVAVAVVRAIYRAAIQRLQDEDDDQEGPR